MPQRNLPLILLAKHNNTKFFVDRQIWKNKLQTLSLVASYRIKGMLGEKYDETCIAAGLPQSFLGLDNEFHL